MNQTSELTKVDKFIEETFIPLIGKSLKYAMTLFLILAIPYFFYVFIQFIQLK